MPVTHQLVGDVVVLIPEGALVIGGPAEEYEQHVQDLFTLDRRHLVTDLDRVPHIDSTGIRALVRGYTTAQRIGGTFRIARPNDRVRRLLRLTRLDTVFEIYDAVDAALARAASR